MRIVEPSILSDWSIWLATAFVGFFTWVGRIVFTNNKRIDALESDNKHARELRVNQEKLVEEIRTDQKKLLNHVLTSKKTGD